MTATRATSHDASSQNEKKRPVDQLLRHTLESALKTVSKQESLSLLSESAYLLTILSRKVSGSGGASLYTSTGRNSSGHSTPNIISEEDENEHKTADAVTTTNSVPLPTIRLNSYIVKPRVISAVSRKAIFKESYTGASMKKTKIGYPLAMPPRLPSVRTGEIIVTKSKRKQEATVIP